MAKKAVKEEINLDKISISDTTSKNNRRDVCSV